MQKVMRILAIVATVLMVVSLLLLLISIPLQSLYAKEVLNYPADMRSALPVIPLPTLLSCLLRAVLVALVIFVCGSKKGGILFDLAVLAGLVIVEPILNGIVTAVYTAVLGGMGYEYVLGNSVATQLSTYCLMPAGWGVVIAYVICGMSIACKKLSKPE